MARSLLRPDYEALVHDGRVHSSVYTDAAIFEDELERIFTKGWVFVGHASEVPTAGDYVRRNLGRQPVLMLRDADGGIQVLSNRCPHRGNMLCWRDNGNTRRAITCSYHAWSFGLKGNLIGVPLGKGLEQSKADISLSKPAAQAEYRGFVFASLEPPVVSFDDYLGNARALIDRTCDLSPEGRVSLGKHWLKHRLEANWKMAADNNTDGYHVGFVHASFLEATNSQYESAVGAKEDDLKGMTRDWGGGHNELEFAPTYRQPLDWVGGKPERYPEYIRAMNARFGEAEATRRLHDGPSHAMIFPNLFLGEMNVEIIEPIGPSSVVLHVTPIMLDGAPELNRRALQQTSGAFGPAAFLFTDDATTAARNQMGLAAKEPAWIDFSRGLSREKKRDGHIEGHFTDETSARGFWKHYRQVMR